MIVSYKCPIIGQHVSSGHAFYVIVNYIIEKSTSVSHVTVLVLIIDFRHNIVKVAMDMRAADYLDNVKTTEFIVINRTDASSKKKYWEVEIYV